MNPNLLGREAPSVFVLSVAGYKALPEWRQRLVDDLVERAGFSIFDCWRIMFVGGAMWLFMFDRNAEGRIYPDPERPDEAARRVEYVRLRPRP